MFITIALTSLFFGFIIGSFLNVVVLRYNTGKNLQGRSSCFSCGHTLNWYELVPVFSWLMQKGRCRKCSSKISTQYIYGELLTGLLFLAVAVRFIFYQIPYLDINYLIGTIYLWVVVAILVVIFLYDIKHKIIPDKLSLSFAVLGFISLFFFDLNNGFVFAGFGLGNIWHILAGLLVPLPFFLVWKISKGALIGLGDPKFMVGMGLFLGITRGFTAVSLAFWIGMGLFLLFYVFQKIRHRALAQKDAHSIMKMEMPFAPFLVIGFLVVLVSGLNLYLL